jgi:hypothetical protein
MTGELTTILSAEIAEIQAEMKSDIRAYNRDPAKRSRHLRSLEQQEAAASPSLPSAGWHGDDAAAVRRAQGKGAAVVATLDTLPDGARGQFVGAFEGLASSIQGAIFGELSRFKEGYVERATETELDAFRYANPHFGSLVRAWGGRASERVGALADRFQRVERSLSETDREQFKAWWRRVPVAEKSAILWSPSGAAGGETQPPTCGADARDFE